MLLERPADSTFISLPTFLRLARCLEPLGWFRPYCHKYVRRRIHANHVIVMFTYHYPIVKM